MKKLLLCLSIFAALIVTSCKENSGHYSGAPVVVAPQPTSSVVVTPEAVGLGESLDLQALGELVKSSQNAQSIEQSLNKSGSINNLDLNGDGQVDYIKVTEYGDGNAKGFSFTVDLPNNETQEIATVELKKGTNDAQMNINGNQQLYGANNHYHSSYSLSDLMIMHYLFSYHRPYYSPYHYGYYPSYYQRYAPVPASSYRSRVSTTTRTSTITRTSRPSTASTIKSPNATKSSKAVSQRAQSLAAPTRSQKSFSTTNTANSKPKTSGFGNKTSSSSSYSPKKSSSSSYGSSSSSSSSSRRSSSFGSSSRSSSSSSSRRRSDERFKTNIQPLKNSLDKITKVEGVSYDWKVKDFPNEHFTDVKQNGVIAQDLEKVFPYLVQTRADGYKEVDYLMLVPTLIEAVKELKVLNDKQAKEIEDLKDALKDESRNREKLVKGLRSL